MANGCPGNLWNNFSRTSLARRQMRLADGPLQHNGDQVGGVEEPEVGNGSVCCFLCSASRGMCEWVTRLNTEVAR